MFPSPIRALALPALTLFWAFAAMASNQYHTLVLELEHRYSPHAIGMAVSLGAFSQIALPWLVLLLERRIRHPDRILRRAYLLLAISLAVFPLVRGHALSLIAYCGIVCGINTAAALQSLAILAVARPWGDQWVLLLRSMGTFGFAASCLLSSFCAPKLDYPGMYAIFAIFALAAFVTSKWSRPQMPELVRTAHFRTLWKSLREPGTLDLLLGVALANLAVTGATSVISNFIHDEIGAGKAQISIAWTIATFCEMPLIWSSIFFLRRFGVKGLILSGIITSTVRMGLLFLVHRLCGLYLVQILHGLFFGATLSGIGIYLDQRYGRSAAHSLQLAAQSFYGGIAATMGGFFTGWIWSWSSLRMVYLAAFVALAIALLWIALRVPAAIKAQALSSSCDPDQKGAPHTGRDYCKPQ
ncbi:MAG TPA: MFS transporter [Fibrobacteraceae bacterium]|nr:MFS transporter [Fibrobacteraceae bacterium]